jgi:hypothetical protein
MALNGTMVKIDTVTVGSGGAASIEFTNIPQTYTDLQIVLSARSATSDVFSQITFISVFKLTKAIALPLKTFTLTWSPFGKAVAPEANPAFKRADKRGATDFPVIS